MQQTHGTVAFAGYDSVGGNLVRIDHGGGWETYVGHLDTLNVKTGDPAPRGTQVGTAGDTGTATGVHVHYEQRLNGVAQPVRFDGALISIGDSPPGPTFKSTNCPTKSGTPSQTSRNLIRHGSFEKGIGFKRRVTSGGTTNLVRYTDKPAQDGKTVMAFNATNGGSVVSDIAFATGAGQSVTASAWLRAQAGTASGRMCVWLLGTSANEQTCVPYSVGETYQRFEAVAASANKHASVRLEFYPSTGTTFADTVALN